MHQEKVQQEKIKVVKARLNFEKISQHSKSGTPSRRRDLRKRLGSRRIRSVSGSPEPRKQGEEYVCTLERFKASVVPHLSQEILKVITRVPAQEEQNLLLRNIITKEHPHAGRKRCQKVKVAQEDTGSHGQKSKDQALRMTIYPSHGGTFGKFPSAEKCIKDPVEIYHIKQRERESMEDFVRRFMIESRDVKGEPEVMRISGFMHGITNPELIKRLHDKISKSVDEMMRITTTFLRGEVAAGNQERKKSLPPWKQQEAGHK
ncbi:hypothetical protein Tco_0087700 [Tanacetum coccineum]